MSETRSKYWNEKFICRNHNCNVIIFLAMKPHFHRNEESTCRKGWPLRYLEQKEAARTSIKAIVRSQNNLSRVLAPGTWGHPWRLVLLQNEEKLSIILNSWSSSTAKADGLEVCVLLIVLSRPFGISWLNILFNLYIFTLKVSNHYQKPNLKDLNKISIFILLTSKWLLFVKHLLLLSSLEKFANSSSNDQKLFFL